MSNLSIEKQQVEPSSARQQALERAVAEPILEAVAGYYPRIKWQVEVNLEGRFIVLRCPMVSFRKGYRILLVNRTMPELLERCVAAAGEILERHAIARSVGVGEDAVTDLRRDLARPDEVADDATPDSAPDQEYKQVH